MQPGLQISPYTDPVTMSGTLPAETYADYSTRGHIDLGSRAERTEYARRQQQSPYTPFILGQKQGDPQPWEFLLDFKNRGLREQWHKPTYRGTYHTIPVPGSWDADLLAGFNRQTIGWYRRQFDLTPQPGRIYKLHFSGVFREASVWLDGTFIGKQEVPYVPFCFDVTRLLAASSTHHLVVRVDDRIRFWTLPCSNIFTKRKHGWFPYGGILRPVCLQIHLPLYVAQAKIDTTLAGAINARLLLENLSLPTSPSTYHLSAWITERGEDTKRLAWSEQQVQAQRSEVLLTGHLDQPRPWSPATPEHRYTLHLRLRNEAGHTEDVGYDFAFRSFEARDQRFFLNGKDTYLRGMNRHEEHPKRGPVYQQANMDQEIALIKELNVNFVRPGHYPVDVRVLQAYEGAGVMIVEEIPVYQLNLLQLASPAIRRLAKQAAATMIIRDYNRPCVVMWSLCNEIHHWFSASRFFVKDLFTKIKSLDAKRPIMLARLTGGPTWTSIFDVFDRICRLVDVVGLNQYMGWYYGKTTDARRMIDSIRRRVSQKTFFISEYGAGALFGRHQDEPPGEEPTKDHSYSEEYQVYYHRQHLQQFDELDYIRGVMPWVLSDFRMEWESKTGKPHPVRLMNLKGLTSFDRDKKLLFEVIKEHYRHRQSHDEPMLSPADDSLSLTGARR